MPGLAWRTTAQVPGPEITVLATVLRLSSRYRAPWFLRDALAVHRQVLASPGALGVSLQARPLLGEYRTLTTWADGPSLRAFVRSDPHRAVMERWHVHLVDARFVQWQQAATDGVPSFAAAAPRLDAAGVQRAPGADSRRAQLRGRARP